MLRFATVFVILLVGMLWVEIQPAVQTGFVMPFTALLADISAALVQVVDPNVIAYNNIIQNRYTGFGVAILPGCNAVEACIILVAGIIAFPAPWRLRLVGVGLGVFAVQLLNLVRIISLFYIGQWNTTAFEIAHTYLWQVLIMLDVLVIWLMWIRFVGRVKREQSNILAQKDEPATS
jgi:exosortase H (IPTLxxWG-CTERM-specific)